ncbi:hypothetical protein E2C01_042535 [Portunus trituberculatus]|uniref:Uncharacterized protein n=1 Tax=Portunus trituberculatus TaxID=210409 RepID=A0A5B7FQI0_PORTR|nr:hypothetical protein [Portunus trituberculatus]
MNDTKGLCHFTDALSTCMRNLKIMGELKQTYESMHVITEKFKGKLRYPYVDESYRHEELDDGTSCEAKNMLRKVEKDREQIKESSGQHANLPCKPLPTKKTMGLMTAASEKLRQTPLRAIMPPDPSTSATNPEESNFLKKRKRGEITALVTFEKNKKDSFGWISKRQTGDEDISTKDIPYHKA